MTEGIKMTASSADQASALRQALVGAALADAFEAAGDPIPPACDRAEMLSESALGHDAIVTSGGDWLVDRPTGTLEGAIAKGDANELAQWARYFRCGQEISMRSLQGTCRVLEEIGFVFSGERLDETESVWNVAAAVARERGHGDRVAEVEASYRLGPLAE